jgi:hypothetical protein
MKERIKAINSTELYLVLHGANFCRCQRMAIIDFLKVSVSCNEGLTNVILNIFRCDVRLIRGAGIAQS